MIPALAAPLYYLLAFWRDEGPSRYQPPKLIEDVFGWAPWWLWFLLSLSAALIVVMESAYKLREAAAASHAEAVTQLRNQIAQLEAARDDLIRVTPAQASGMRPTGQGQTVWEVVAYLDVETADCTKPLHNCRIKLLDLYLYYGFSSGTKAKLGSGTVGGEMTSTLARRMSSVGVEEMALLKRSISTAKSEHQ